MKFGAKNHERNSEVPSVMPYALQLREEHTLDGEAGDVVSSGLEYIGLHLKYRRV